MRTIEVLRMRADLRVSPTRPTWPNGISIGEWNDSFATQVHELLKQAHARGGGEVADHDTWVREFTGDAEFDPSACILAWSGDSLAGVALCWSSAS